jgi:hypothetical protein
MNVPKYLTRKNRLKYIPIYLLTYTRSACTLLTGSWDSSVCTATGYAVRLPPAARVFSTPQRPDRIRGPPSLLSNGYREWGFPGIKAAGA